MMIYSGYMRLWTSICISRHSCGTQRHHIAGFYTQVSKSRCTETCFGLLLGKHTRDMRYAYCIQSHKTLTLVAKCACLQVLATLTNLQDLMVHGSSAVTDLGLMSLTKLTRLTLLQVLSLYSSEVSPQLMHERDHAIEISINKVRTPSFVPCRLYWHVVSMHITWVARCVIDFHLRDAVRVLPEDRQWNPMCVVGRI